MTGDTKSDAGNRTMRTFLQGLGFTILAAAVMVLLPVFTSATGWSSFDPTLIGFSLVQAVGTAVLAWLMRTVVDTRTSLLRPADERGVLSTGLVFVIGLLLGLILYVVLIGPALHRG